MEWRAGTFIKELKKRNEILNTHIKPLMREKNSFTNAITDKFINLSTR